MKSSSITLSMSYFFISVLHSFKSIIYCINKRPIYFTSYSLYTKDFFTISLRLKIPFVWIELSDFSGKNLQRRRLLGRQLVTKGLNTKGLKMSQFVRLSSIYPIGSSFIPKSILNKTYNRKGKSICEV